VDAINPAESAKDTSSDNKVAFRWIYLALPAAILLIAVILTAIFYRLLPLELAYHFQDGTPDKWLGRGAMIAWLVVPHAFLVLLAYAVVRMTIMTTSYWQTEGTPINRLLMIMANMVTLPQIILFFAMLDIFLYNAYQIKLIPLWVFALIVLVLGGIVLGILLFQTAVQFRRLQGKSPQE